MSPFESVLAAAIILGAIFQGVVLYLLYRVVRRLSDRTVSLIDTLEPEVQDMGAAIHAARRAVEISSTELRATLSAVRATTAELGALVNKTAARADRQLDELDHSLDQARDRVTGLGHQFDRVVLEPVRVALSIGMGVRRAFEVMTGHRAHENRADGGEPRVGSA